MSNVQMFLYKPLNKPKLRPFTNENFVTLHKNLPREIPYTISAMFGNQLPVIMLGCGDRSGYKEYRQFFFNDE